MAQEESKIKIISPQAGGQEKFVRTSVDIAIFGGTLGGGKSFGAILANSEPFLDSNYRAVFFRRTLGELKSAGGIVSDFEMAYGDSISIKISENPRITFKQTGAWIECRQIADENPQKVRETFKGLQADAIFFEELTGFSFYTWNYLASRARGTGKWTGKVRATTNPSKSHWVRRMLKHYIGEDGFVPPEKSGMVMYVYLDGDSVDDYVWGETKEEVYWKAKASIDRKLKMMKDDTITYENLIKSFTFILGNLAENKALLGANRDYVGNVSGKEGEALLLGNWLVDMDSSENQLIQPKNARLVVENGPCTNGRKYICADLADTGKDATVILAIDGFHVFDYMILPKSTPRQNADWIKRMALKHGIADSHIIYDGQRAAYMIDYIPEAISYISFVPARGIYMRNFKRMKDECYMRLAEAINSGRFSIDEKVANSIYEHSSGQQYTILNEFAEECGVVEFEEDFSGKKKLLTKKAMNSRLTGSKSMDLCDAIHMVMSQYIFCEYGTELEVAPQNDDYEDGNNGGANIYDETFWC